MTRDLYWHGLFKVIERTLSPHRKPAAPPSKRVVSKATARKPKALTKTKSKKRAAPKRRKVALRSRARSVERKTARRAKKTSR